MSEFPTANEIAQAVVMASRAVGEDPARILTNATVASRARLIAYDALRGAFPKARRPPLARALGFARPDGNAPSVAVCSAKGRDWWSEVLVDEIVGVLVTDQYEERAR